MLTPVAAGSASGVAVREHANAQPERVAERAQTDIRAAAPDLSADVLQSCRDGLETATEQVSTAAIEEASPLKLYRLRADPYSPVTSPIAGDPTQTPSSTPIASTVRATLVDLSPEQIRYTLDYFVLCADRVGQMTKTYNDVDAVQQLLEEKEKDLELAAHIGQSLLEQNRELQQRSEFLEAELISSNDTVVQLKHDLQRKADLLHLFSETESEGGGAGGVPSMSPCSSPVGPLSPSSTARTDRRGVTPRSADVGRLQGKVSAMEEENLHLQLEAAHLKSITQSLEEKEQQLVSDCVKQLETANKRIDHLHDELVGKSEECDAQQHHVSKLLRELVTRQTSEKTVMFENEALAMQLQQAQEVQAELTKEIMELQDRYAEVVAMLHEAQQELKHFRRSHRSFSSDSMYESLASELEASDSGFGGGYTNAGLSYSHNNSSVNTSGRSVGDEILFHDRFQSSPVGARSSPREGSVKHKAQGATVPGPSATPHKPRSAAETVPEDPKTPPSAASGGTIPQLQFSPPAPSLPPLDASLVGKAGLDVSTATRIQKRQDGEPLRSSTSLADQPPTCQGGATPSASATTNTVMLSPFASPSSSPPRGAQTTNEAAVQNALSPPSSASTTKSDGGARLSKTPSTDSLASYDGPEKGVPGLPGTRDLEFAIRRLATRRRVELEFQSFKRLRNTTAAAALGDTNAASCSRSKHADRFTLERPIVPTSAASSSSRRGPSPARSSRVSSGGAGGGSTSKFAIYKPMEGSRTLRQWRQLATGGIDDPAAILSSSAVGGSETTPAGVLQRRNLTRTADVAAKGPDEAAARRLHQPTSSPKHEPPTSVTYSSTVDSLVLHPEDQASTPKSPTSSSYHVDDLSASVSPSHSATRVTAVHSAMECGTATFSTSRGLAKALKERIPTSSSPAAAISPWATRTPPMTSSLSGATVSPSHGIGLAAVADVNSSADVIAGKPSPIHRVALRAQPRTDVGANSDDSID